MSRDLSPNLALVRHTCASGEVSAVQQVSVRPQAERQQTFTIRNSSSFVTQIRSVYHPPTKSYSEGCGMKECLVDVLNARNTVVHVFPIPVENQDGTPRPVNPEQEALELAAGMQIVPEAEALHARPHVSRGGPLLPYGDVVELKHDMCERTEQRVRERAYFLWQQEDCSENRADEHWHRARETESHGG